MGNARDYRALLFAGRWFSGLPEPLQEALLDAARVRELTDKEQLFSRGDAPCGLYGVVSGAIRIRGIAETGQEALLTLLEPPSWFGEVSLFDDQPCTHDALAVGASCLVHVPKDALEAILDEQPHAWRHLGRLLTTKLRIAFELLEEISLAPGVVRLAHRLAKIAAGYGERLAYSHRTVAISQDELARMLSMSRQTTNQLLRQLASLSLIKLGYGSIEILDLDGLRGLGGRAMSADSDDEAEDP